MSKFHTPRHEYRGKYQGADRWAQVYEIAGGYDIMCFINQIYQGTRQIRGHSEEYAENAAENFVLGLYDKP